MWQATWTRDALVAFGCDVEIVRITTTGDADRNSAIINLGAQGVFTKEIQKALLNNEIDVAAHSLKDLPVEPVPGLRLTAVPKRGDWRDVFLSNRYETLDDLPPGAIVGTSSARRKSMALRYQRERRPDETPWDVRNARGNVETRLRKLDDGEFDAIILANAGLTRLGFDDRKRVFLPQPEFLPAVGQGALGLETREDDEETNVLVSQLLDVPTYLSVVAERAFLATLKGGCLAPVGARARIAIDPAVGAALAFDYQVLSLDGSQWLGGSDRRTFDETAPLETNRACAERCGVDAAERLLAAGVDELLRDVKMIREENARRNSSR